jgi:hypothetical protein
VLPGMQEEAARAFERRLFNGAGSDPSQFDRSLGERFS